MAAQQFDLVDGERAVIYFDQRLWNAFGERPQPRRETASEYLKAAGVPVRGRGRPGEGAAKPAISAAVSTDSPPPVWPPPSRAPQASACEPYREDIAAALARGRNAMAIWQDLVDTRGFPARYASVRRFVGQLKATAPPEARVVIVTTPAVTVIP